MLSLALPSRRLGVAFAGDRDIYPVDQPAAGAAPVSFVIGDFNRDGKPDLAVVDQRSATVRILLGVGNGISSPG